MRQLAAVSFHTRETTLGSKRDVVEMLRELKSTSSSGRSGFGARQQFEVLQSFSRHLFKNLISKDVSWTWRIAIFSFSFVLPNSERKILNLVAHLFARTSGPGDRWSHWRPCNRYWSVRNGYVCYKWAILAVGSWLHHWCGVPSSPAAWCPRVRFALLRNISFRSAVFRHRAELIIHALLFSRKVRPCKQIKIKQK